MPNSPSIDQPESRRTSRRHRVRPRVAARLSAERSAIVTGIDPAPVMLRVASRADRRRSVTWLRVAEALPLPDRSHDVAWSLSTVHHWPDLMAGLAEVTAS